MDVHVPQDDEFMEIEDEEHGWSEEGEDDYDNFRDPEFDQKISSFQPKLTSGFHFKLINESEIEEK